MRHRIRQQFRSNIKGLYRHRRQPLPHHHPYLHRQQPLRVQQVESIRRAYPGAIIANNNYHHHHYNLTSHATSNDIPNSNQCE